MFQSDVLTQYYSNNRKSRKADAKYKSLIKSNSLTLAEGEGVAATSLGKNNEIKIHRVPSVEGAAATSLGNPKLTPI